MENLYFELEDASFCALHMMRATRSPNFDSRPGGMREAIKFAGPLAQGVLDLQLGSGLINP